MNTKNEKTAKKLYQLFNERNLNGLSEIVDAKCVTQDLPSGEQYKGVDGMKKWLDFWVTTCSDMKASVKVIATSDTMAVVEGTADGKNDGPVMLPNGQTIKATGRKLHMQWVDLIEFKSDRIIGMRSYYDSGSIMTQLGVAQGQQPAKTRRPTVV